MTVYSPKQLKGSHQSLSLRLELHFQQSATFDIKIPVPSWISEWDRAVPGSGDSDGDCGLSSVWEAMVGLKEEEQTFVNFKCRSKLRLKQALLVCNCPMPSQCLLISFLFIDKLTLPTSRCRKTKVFQLRDGLMNCQFPSTVRALHLQKMRNGTPSFGFLVVHPPCRYCHFWRHYQAVWWGSQIAAFL